MSTRRGNDIGEEGASHRADASAKVNPAVDLKDMSEESKAEWLKRRNREDRKHKAGLKIVDEWFELVAGKKLVKKFKKNNGGMYSIYICNIKKPRNAGVMAGLVKTADGKFRQKAATK